MPTQISPPILLNANASISVGFDGSIQLNTGTDDVPGSEYEFGAAGQILVNGSPLQTGGPSSSPVTLAANGSVNIQTGTAAAPGPLFQFTADGKLLKNGVDFAGAAAAEPSWVTPVLLGGWANDISLNQFPHEPVRYRLNGNKLEFSGLANGSNAAGPSQTNVIFRLPAAIYSRLQYQKSMGATVYLNQAGTIKIFPNGNVLYAGGPAQAGGAVTLGFNNLYIYLDS